MPRSGLSGEGSPVERAHDAGCDRVVETERLTDRDDAVTDGTLLESPSTSDGQLRRRRDDVEDRKVAGWIRTDDRRLVGRPVRELDPDRPRPVDHVIVGDDVALRVIDEPGALATCSPPPLAGYGDRSRPRSRRSRRRRARNLRDLADGQRRARRDIRGGGRRSRDRDGVRGGAMRQRNGCCAGSSAGNRRGTDRRGDAVVFLAMCTFLLSISLSPKFPVRTKGDGSGT